jgi:hypothetical protein
MHTWVALGAALLAAIVSVTVPWVALRTALRLEGLKWVREQRTKLYVDVLAHSHAELAWARNETRLNPRDDFQDQRLAGRERMEMGARMTLVASRTAHESFLAFTSAIDAVLELGPADDGRKRHERWHAADDVLKSLQT